MKTGITGTLRLLIQGIKSFSIFHDGGSRGYSLIELIVSVVILGLVVAGFSKVGTHVVTLSADNGNMTEAVRIVRNGMEEAVRSGTSAGSTGWISEGSFQWKREVNVLRSGPDGPTLIEVKVKVKNSRGLICSLFTHIAE